MHNSRLTKSALLDIGLAAVRQIRAPLLLYGIVIAVLIVMVLIQGKDVPAALSPLPYGLSAVVLLVAALHFFLEYRKQYGDRMGHIRAPLQVPLSRSPVKGIFDRSDSAEFHGLIEKLVRDSDHMVFIGTGLNVLQRDPLAQEVMGRAARGSCHLEIYLANPQSPDIEVRLVEEETGQPKPPVGRDGLRGRLDCLMGIWCGLGYPDTVSIRLFPNYPTFALIIIDNDYFLYPYGYAKLGNFSPVLHFSRNDVEARAVIQFLDDQHRGIRDISIDARQLPGRSAELNAETLHPFAVYFIPPATSRFYHFGAEVLGYDIRRHAFLPSRWEKHVGSARDFGFHLTVCDALYFVNPREVERAMAEVEFLLKDFRPFELTNLRIIPSFPDRESMAIGLDDPTGSLEAIHHELVHRVYRRAAGSNYSLGRAPLTRDSDDARTRIMIQRYLAPYVLGRFTPHFTLMTGADPGKQVGIAQQLDGPFTNIKTEPVRVERFALMRRPSPEEPWHIEKEIIL